MSGPLDPENQKLFNTTGFIHHPVEGLLLLLVAKPLAALVRWVRRQRS